MTVKELLRRYAHGERDFRGIVLRKRDLSEATLVGSHFDDADLSGSRFSGADLSGCHLDPVWNGPIPI